MNRAALISLTASALWFAGSASAQAACTPEFVDSSVSVSVPNITVTSGGVTEETFSFRVRNSGAPGNCPASLRIARSNTSPSSSNIAYTVRVAGSTLDILPSETAPPTPGSIFNLASVSPGTNGSNVPMKLVVPSGWGLAAGNSTEDLLIQLFDQSGNLVDTLPLTVNITIQPAVELRIVGVTGTSAIASISLGELDPQSLTVSDPFGLRIWSTSPYTIAFQSQNNGGLLHSNSTDRIEYDLYLSSQKVSLVGAVAKTVAQGTSAFGDQHPLTVRIAPFTAKAGQYSDRVEVTVSAS